MSVRKARTIRTFFTVLLVAMGLALTSALYAQDREEQRNRSREARNAKQVTSEDQAKPGDQTPATDAKRGARSNRPTEKGKGTPPAPTASPNARPQSREGARVWRERQKAVNPPASSQPQRPQRAEPSVRPESDRQVAPQRPALQERPGPERVQVSPERGQERDRGQGMRPQGRAGQRQEQQRPFLQVTPERPRGQVPVRGGQAERVNREMPAPLQARERVQRVPEASFRGPEAERNVRVVQPGDGERVQRQLRDQVRNLNIGRPGLPTRERLTRDVLGNTLPPDTTIIRRDNINRLSVGFTRVRKECGDPKFYYAFAPRSRSDYWDGYWDGFADGHEAAKHHFHGHHVVVSFYYPYYWSDPLWFAFYYPGFYPTVYSYWGWTPGWVYPNRCYYSPGDYVYAPATPYRYYGGSYVDQQGADRALNDIRRAWYEGDISKLAYHLTDNEDIRVYFDGEYEYSTSTEDYYAMTADTMATTQTTELGFDRPIWLSNYEFFVTGRHVFYDPNGNEQVVYVSYRLRKISSEWYIVSVGSSLNPIQHQYRDFRY